MGFPLYLCPACCGDTIANPPADGWKQLVEATHLQLCWVKAVEHYVHHLLSGEEKIKRGEKTVAISRNKAYWLSAILVVLYTLQF